MLEALGFIFIVLLVTISVIGVLVLVVEILTNSDDIKD